MPHPTTRTSSCRSSDLPAETRAFLIALLARADSCRHTACLTLTAIHPGGQQRTPSRHIPLDRPDLLDDALERLLAASRLGWGAFVAVGLRRSGLTRWQRGGAADVVALPALYVDVDDPSAEALARLQTCTLPPSCITFTGGGYHAYWWLDAPTADLSRAGRALRALARHLGGDTLSVAQSLRLPQTINTKSDRGGLCHVIQMNDRRCSLGAFDALPPDHAGQPQQREKPYTTTPATARASRLNSTLVQIVADRLVSMGYSGRGDWLSGPCLHPARHRHGDTHPSFGFNTRTGYGNCFVCGSMLLQDICAAIGIRPHDYGGLYISSV